VPKEIIDEQTVVIRFQHRDYTEVSGRALLHALPRPCSGRVWVWRHDRKACSEAKTAFILGTLGAARVMELREQAPA
jgi:fructoselysine-6-P-deglycase FrlB-like protein